MRLAIISDVHLGYGSDTELSGDPFEALSEALDKSMGCDAILMAGDLFDNRSPSTEVLTGAMELLLKPILAGQGARLYKGLGKDVASLTPLHQQGIPVIAIHGTHERRVKGMMNPVEALERTGFLIHLHCNGVVIEKGGERVCVQGMSGVPDQFSAAVLDRWGPSPEKGCFNIMMIHQSVSPFMYARHLLPVEKLPRGHDLYILGHIHESKLTEHAKSPLIIPGSLVSTQLTKDAVAPRGFWVFDTRNRESAFIPLDSQRRLYRIESTGKPEELESEIESLLEHEHSKIPLIRIMGEADIPALRARFGERSIISVRQSKKEEAGKPVSMAEHRMSVKELGSTILKKNLSAAGLDTDRFEGLFEMLESGNAEGALRFLRTGPKD